MKHKSDYQEVEYKTAKQWEVLGKVPMKDAQAAVLWTNHFHNMQAHYFTLDQVREMTTEEKETHARMRREKTAALREKRKRAKLALKKEEEDRIRKAEEQEKQREAYRIGRAYMKQRIDEASMLPEVPCNNPSGIIVLDVETTGLDSEYDEILQISMIDGDGNVLINEYVKPYYMTEWDTVHIHGITTDMVKDALSPHELIPRIKGIMNSAELLVSYNGAFDLSFLSYWGIQAQQMKQCDVMQEFAPIYGEWDEKHECYRWKSLTVCAEYFNYQFNAHNSLEDTKVTLWCYNHIISLIQDTKRNNQ